MNGKLNITRYLRKALAVKKKKGKRERKRETKTKKENLGAEMPGLELGKKFKIYKRYAQTGEIKCCG